MNLFQFTGYRMLWVVIIILFILLIYYHNVRVFEKSFDQRYNNTETFETLSRHIDNQVLTSKRVKRFLIFQGGGVVKLVFGLSFPIAMADKKRSLNYFYNFQMQYVPPAAPLYWWSVFNTTTFAARKNLRKRSMEKWLLGSDDRSRTLIYEFIEEILKRSGGVDGDCLLKIICELARAPLAEDLFPIEKEISPPNNEDKAKNKIVDDYGRNIYHKLINIIFIPPDSNVDERYLNARVAGQNGANCDKTFGRCHIVANWIKQFTRLF